MNDWKDVKNHAKDEASFAQGVADAGTPQIEQFYPELYPSSGIPSFTNTLGSYLIPDLLTSQHVVVDIYDWPSPDSLIEVYGVDLAFLLALRDAKLITICANLPIQRYKAHSWVYTLLADHRTIFRSIRTPAFVSAADRDFERRRLDREKHLSRHFGALPGPELQRLCEGVKSAHPPSDARSLASVLAQWIERLATFEPEIAAKLGDQFERDVIGRVPELMRLQRLIVSPYTAALGSMMKIERKNWAALFGEESIDSLLIDGQVRFQNLNTYFSEATLSLDSVDLTSAELWKSIRHSERNKIIEYLSDEARKAELMAIEEEVRIGLVKGGDRDPTRKTIRRYVEKLNSEVENLRRLKDVFGIAAPIAFGVLSENVLAGLSVAGGIFSSKYLLGEHLRRLTENLIGKLRVVRVLGKRDQ